MLAAAPADRLPAASLTQTVALSRWWIATRDGLFFAQDWCNPLMELPRFVHPNPYRRSPMSKRPFIVVGGIVFVVAGWALFRPELLFIDKTVNESFPTATAAAVKTSMPAQAMPLASGMFHSVAHDTKGTATILQLPNGQRVLRLTNFETSNGPDVRVLLVAANDASDNDTVKNNMPRELAPLKGNIGDQNYDIPADVDLAKYKAATIWCNRFSVNFGTAPLTTAGTGSEMSPSVAMHDAMPAQPTALATGMFHSVAHDTKGTATVYKLADGKRVLRLSDFETSNGPDVRVLLVAANDASDNDTVKNNKPIELGKLKGNVGDQNYDIPADVDLAKYKAATIWCNRFSVNFGTAALK
jgi:hypothetical protein